MLEHRRVAEARSGAGRSACGYAWPFLVPAVAELIDAVRGQLPGVATTLGVVVVIIGVAIVNHPRAVDEVPELDDCTAVVQNPLR
jgi:hypothetical protein